MATSGSYNWQLTQREIILTALDLCNITPMGREPMPEVFQACVRYLQLVNSSLETQANIHLWKVFRSSNLYPTAGGTVQTVLTVGTATYYLAPEVLDVLEVNLRVSGVDSPLTRMSRREYMELSEKTTSGTPNSYYIESNVASVDPVNARTLQGGLTITLYPVPSVANSLYYSATRALADLDSTANDPDAPRRWMRLLVYGLACELATRGAFPLNERAAFKAEYEAEKLKCGRDDNERGPMSWHLRYDNAWSR